jgi:hypothetical protein
MPRQSAAARDALDADLGSAELVPFPESVKPEQVKVGTILMVWGENEQTGKLYKVTEIVAGANPIKMVREDGKKFHGKYDTFMLAPASRRFPALPEYVPGVGDLVQTARLRGVSPDTVLFVGSITKGKAKCWLLDGSHRSASMAFAALTKVDGEKVTITVAD